MDRQENHLYEFGRFLLDPTERLLLRDGQPVQITPKCFDILVALVKKSGHLIGKDELLNEVWPDQFVEEGNLSFNISILRKVLSDGEPELHYIQTVQKRGYRFTADLKVVQVNGPTGNGKGPPEKLLVTSIVSRHKTAAMLVITTIGIVVGYFAFFAPRIPVSINSIAVLPFVNVGNDPNLEHLSDGLSESLINNLSQLSQLKVIGRGSAFRYKGQEVEPEEVGRALGVQAIVTGRITQRGDELHISVEMVNARDKTQIWGEQYTRRAADLQALQAEIVRTVLDKLRLKLTGAQEQQLTRHATQNPQAHQLYLNGLFYMRKGAVENVRKALPYYNQAVALDPNFALAWAGLAEAYISLGRWSLIDPNEALAKATVAAQKALELDEKLAEARLALAAIKADEWDWAGADREFRRVIELNPKLAEAHFRYSSYLSVVGRHTEALAAIKRAQELDPLWVRLWAREGRALYAARRYDEAIEKTRQVLQLEPDSIYAGLTLGYAYAAKGMYAQSVEAYQKNISIEGEKPGNLCFLGYALAKSGRTSEAQSILDRLKSSKEYVSPAELAVLYIGLGDNDGAIASLERGYAAHHFQMLFLRVDQHFDPLRPDPRFSDLMRRVGLPQQ